MWPLKSRLLPPPAPAKRATSCGRALEPHAGRVQRLAVEIGPVGLEELDLGARRTKPPGEVLLERRAPARGGSSGRSGGRVEADQRGGERDELALAGRDLGDDLLFQLAQGHARQSRGSPSGGAPDRVHAASPSIGAP